MLWWAPLNGIMVNGIIQLMGSNWSRLIKSQKCVNSILCIRNIFCYSCHLVNGINIDQPKVIPLTSIQCTSLNNNSYKWKQLALNSLFLYVGKWLNWCIPFIFYFPDSRLLHLMYKHEKYSLRPQDFWSTLLPVLMT
jgi:hypothetical protein